MNTMLKTLAEKLDHLRLNAMSQYLDRTITEAASANLSFAATLERLTDLEAEARRQRSVERHVKMSKLHLPQSRLLLCASQDSTAS